MSRSLPIPGRDDRAGTTRHATAASPVERAVGVSEVEDSALARTGLERIDYVDHVVLTSVDVSRATPEQWARAMFGDVPTPGERFIWRGLLQLRLRRGRSPSTVAGWRIARPGQDWIRLQAASWALGVELVIRATEATVSLTTFVEYDRIAGRLVWPPLSAVHRRLAPGVLRDAAAAVAGTVDR